MSTLLQSPFFQVTLPLMVTFVATVWIAQWSQNKRFDDWTKRFDELRLEIKEIRFEINHRFDSVLASLSRVEEKIDGHGQRITRLEERTSPLRH